MKIKLVVTGDMEKAVLAQSLARVLLSDPPADDVELAMPRKVHPTTSARLCPVDDGRIPSTINGMVRAMVAEIVEGSDGSPSDLVVGVDDLELANLDQPEVVIGWLRRAVEEEVDERYPSARAADRLRERLRERCSFHFFKPMAEAYFYGESSAMRRAGVRPDITPRRMGRDVEEFETDDPEFLQHAGEESERHAALGHHWWCIDKHPKRYLEFLCQQTGGIYSEMSGGKEALGELDWITVAMEPGTVAYARALFEDIADFLNIDNPLPPGPLSPITYPDRSMDRSRLTLRNL